ncbi:uncharacterized protein CEXT_317981 [Caerostris extrusa]|uniref:Uncharacterized protein n=1 Tax=Caerostris extrusa TaxID=172846 RepID=A0AAV4MH27_CAEEX|nr:uncharacterized protein CEXT_317981 [Caerostris extrusa]
MENSLEYSEQIIKYKSRVNRYLSESVQVDKNEINKVPVVTSEIKKECNTKLPELIWRSLMGISRDFNFWPQFTSVIHDNHNLNDIEKFNYLKTLLTDSALIAISGLPFTADNYKKAIDILTDRFGKTDILISTHMNVLLSLEPVRNSSDVSTLRKLYDKITIQIRCLESLKVDINSYGNLLLPILYKCIPNDLVLRFNRQNSESEATVTSLLSCIKERNRSARKDSLF